MLVTQVLVPAVRLLNRLLWLSVCYGFCFCKKLISSNYPKHWDKFTRIGEGWLISQPLLYVSFSFSSLSLSRLSWHLLCLLSHMVNEAADERMSDIKCSDLYSSSYVTLFTCISTLYFFINIVVGVVGLRIIAMSSVCTYTYFFKYTEFLSTANLICYDFRSDFSWRSRTLRWLR